MNASSPKTELSPTQPHQSSRREFLVTGTIHILSISGFHLSVMALLALLLLRLTGDRGWVEPVIVALLILAVLGTIVMVAVIILNIIFW